MSQYEKPPGALGKMYEKIHELDERNWYSDEYDRAWKMGGQEMLYNIELLLLDKMPEKAREIRDIINQNLKK